MRCEKCDGKGCKDNPKYYEAKCKYKTDYYLTFEPTIKCRACKGTGYVIGDVKDVLNFLRGLEMKFSHFKDDIEYLDKVRECIKIIEKK